MGGNTDPALDGEVHAAGRLVVRLVHSCGSVSYSLFGKNGGGGGSVGALGYGLWGMGYGSRMEWG